MPTTDAPASPAPTTGAVRRYRPELQGLRAVAVVLVVSYHVWLGRVSGGVDVFFLISGFLLTGQLVRAAGRGPIAFRPLWGRMIKRLFPAALTVLLGVLVLGMVLLPEDRWFQTIGEVFASALYVENWRLAADSVDYFAQHNTASVVQHFWSLSIQGQFYVAWPLLIALVAMLATRLRRSLTASVAVVLAVLFAGSLAYSVHLTAVNQPLAYFHSATRIWEFAFGGLLALVLDRVVLPRLARIVLGWVGVAALITCGLVLDVGEVFPGWAALWPTTAAALVILAGATGSAVAADRLLASKPLEYVGNLSYALYLWHWPVLVLYLVARHREVVGPLGGAVVIGTSVLLAAATHHFVEQPLRTSRVGERTRWGAYRFGVLALLPVLVVTLGWQVASTKKAGFSIALDDDDHPGALARDPDSPKKTVPGKDVVPPMIAVPNDWGGFADAGCVRSRFDEILEVCTWRPAGTPSKRLVAVGDSHVQQYLAALKPAAEKNGYQVTFMLKGACPFSTTSDAMPGDPGCLAWNAAAQREILDQRPDAVVTLSTRDVRPGLTEQTPQGFVDQWRVLDRAGIPVVALRDNPRMGFSPPACVEAHGVKAPECSVPRATLLADPPPYDGRADIPANVSFLDFGDYFCGRSSCRPVVGNVLVYMDDNHVTASFMATLSPVLEKAMVAALGW
ncbi:acyltransferase [Amycolatopsis sp. OK19-0408]|uniref:Acyltransferase n=1 Tax=Amycolatopsis iheyensis TaxID=2945988 RepID=A0A9X2N946_9PSEU|nr:acyltransferase family protein [Amycolatopsis iheyensis]MCR6482913.1 acyltransferase [Amycolatopsis iheyensis]